MANIFSKSKNALLNLIDKAYAAGVRPVQQAARTQLGVGVPGTGAVGNRIARYADAASKISPLQGTRAQPVVDAVQNVAKAIVRAPVRTLAQITNTNSGRKSFVPQGGFQKVLYGDPVDTLQDRVKYNDDFVKSVGIKRNSMPLALGLTGAGVISDLIPFNPKKGATVSLEELAKAATAKDVAKIIAKDLPEVKKLSYEAKASLVKGLTEAKTPQAVKAVLDSHVPAKVTPKVKINRYDEPKLKINNYQGDVKKPEIKVNNYQDPKVNHYADNMAAEQIDVKHYQDKVEKEIQYLRDKTGRYAGSKVVEVKPTQMAGVAAGIEPEYDENGRPTGKFHVNPLKAAAGLAGTTIAGRTGSTNELPKPKAALSKLEQKTIQSLEPATEASAKVMGKSGEYVEKSLPSSYGKNLPQGKQPVNLEGATKLNKKGEVVNIVDKQGNVVPRNLQTAIVNAVKADRDKGKLALHNQTPVRNIEDVFGKDADIVKQYLPERAAKNEVAKVSWVDKEKTELKEVLEKQLGLKIGKKEDQLAHRFAERRISLEDLQKEAPGNWQKIVQAAEVTRAKYDQYLEQINSELTKFGYSPIPKRADYVTHLNELNVANSLFGNLTSIAKEKLPAIMSKIHLETKPGRQWFKFGKQRQGGPFVESVLNALDTYIPAAGNQIFHTDTVQTARTFQKTLQDTLEMTPETKALSNFASWSNDYINHLAGKRSIVDRSIEETVGRQIPSAINWLRQRTSANMVGANVSSALTNFIPLTQSLATTSKSAAAQALVRAGTAPFSKAPEIIDGVKSSFLARRFGGDTKLGENLTSKAVKGANWLFGAIDKLVASTVVGGKYYEGLQKGLDKTAAMKAADDYGARLLADRSFGQMPTLYNSKTIGLLTQFQLEVNNQLSFLGKDIPKMVGGNKAKLASVLGQIAVYSYVYNTLFEQATGRRPALDPIGIGIDTYEDIKNKSDKTAQNAIERVSGSLPYVGTVTGGGRVPLSGALPDVAGLIKGETTFMKEAKKPATYLLPPTGGGQIKKFLEGDAAYQQGASTTDTGKVRFTIDKNLPNNIRTHLFGQYSTPEAKEYFDKGQTPLSAKQSEEVKLKGKESYDAVRFKQSQKADQTKLQNDLKEKAKGKASAAESDKWAKAYGYETIDTTKAKKLVKDKNIPSKIKDQLLEKNGINPDKFAQRLEYEGKSSQYEQEFQLSKDRLTRSKDKTALKDLYQSRIKQLETYLGTLDKEKDKTQFLKTTNKIEDLRNAKGNKGGASKARGGTVRVTKGRKAKKGKVAAVKSQLVKVNAPRSRRVKTPTVRIAAPKAARVRAISTPSIKVKLPKIVKGKSGRKSRKAIRVTR